MSAEIVLVRHGRSAHLHSGLVDRDGFLRWREAYESAGIAEGETPPADLVAIARTAETVVASDAPRAAASACLLAPGKDVLVSALLRELSLTPPGLHGIRLPLAIWALTYAMRMMKRSLASPSEVVRAADAARWLDGIVRQRVVAVTHATFRKLLAEQLRRLGWAVVQRRGRTSHWSAWTLRRLEFR